MKTIKSYLCYAMVMALVLTSCSQQDSSGSSDITGDKAVLSLGPILNDLVNKAANKQESSLPECSDTEPAFAFVSLTYETSGADVDVEVVVEISQDAQGYFTLYDEALEIPIPAGQTTVGVTLNDFMIYNDVADPLNPEAPGTLIWMAPLEGSEYAKFVGDPLPIAIELRAGTKNYSDVEVLCFDNRVVNKYGYQFFDIIPIPMIEFCLFGNYCPDGPEGRHKTASYAVDVWEYSNGTKGTQLYFAETSTALVQEDGGQMYADPLCFFLPDREGQDTYWFEITLLDVEGYYDGLNRVILEGPITDDEIKDFFDDENPGFLDYYHFQFGCEGDIPPPFFDPEVDAKHYSACIKTLDDGDTIGFAYFSLEGNDLTTTVWAVERPMNSPVPQHIHENASCEDYGGVFWSLYVEEGGVEVPPTSMGSWLQYERTFPLSDEQVAALDLGNRSYVLHLEDFTPVACGEINMIN
ncbi:hypothetical protein [Salinimicrobium soli]|uniref:hypothetical protein n=1 Tax=Salinimicrobium soli TaxID=1254399 RepID=UPI003AAB2C24